MVVRPTARPEERGMMVGLGRPTARPEEREMMVGLGWQHQIYHWRSPFPDRQTLSSSHHKSDNQWRRAGDGDPGLGCWGSGGGGGSGRRWGCGGGGSGDVRRLLDQVVVAWECPYCKDKGNFTIGYTSKHEADCLREKNKMQEKEAKREEERRRQLAARGKGAGKSTKRMAAWARRHCN